MNLPGPILFVDDDADDHDVIKMICSKLGVQSPILFFYTAQELVAFLKTSDVKPFVILCDINMPMVNGLDVRELIWKDEALRRKSIPFVFFSTAATKDQVERAFDLTVQGFFLKGRTPAETERKLKNIFDYWLDSKSPNSFD